jgi:hypothetical protein
MRKHNEAFLPYRLTAAAEWLAMVCSIITLGSSPVCGGDLPGQTTPTPSIRGTPLRGPDHPPGGWTNQPSQDPTVTTNVDQMSSPAQGKNLAPEVKDGFLVLGFEKLASFPITGYSVAPIPAGPLPKSKPFEQIPKDVQALDGKRLEVRGFMLPMKGAGGSCTEFLLLRNRSACCYGVMPRLNEWVVVCMPGKGVKPIMDQPITVSGKLHVGEVYKYDRLVGIYQMEGEKIDTRQP